MAGDKDKKKKRSSKKGSKDRAKSRAKPLDAEAFDRAATTLNDATAKLMRAAERHALGDVNHDGAPPDDRVRWYEEGRRASAWPSRRTRSASGHPSTAVVYPAKTSSAVRWRATFWG